MKKPPLKDKRPKKQYCVRLPVELVDAVRSKGIDMSKLIVRCLEQAIKS